MDIRYLSNENTGGAINYLGTAFQDCVSLIYLFDNIDDKDFREITFETINDFTIIFKDYEVCVQVKSNDFNFKVVRDLLEKLDIKKDKKYVFVCSKYNEKFRIFLDKLRQVKTSIKSSRMEHEKREIIEDFKSILQKHSLEYEKIINVEFKEFSLENRIELAKLKIYEWEKRNGLNIDVDNLFDSLISKLTQNLCTHRGFLSKNSIYELALKYKPRKINKKSEDYIKFVEVSVDSIIESLKIDANSYKMFSKQLNMTALYIFQNDLRNALKEIESIVNYQNEFQKYKFFILNLNEDYNKLKKYCIEVLKNDKKNYYGNYYLGIEYRKSNKYKKAIECFLNSIDSIDTFEANYNLAELYERSGQIKNSLKYYNICLAKDSMSIKANLNISKLLPYSKAIKHLETVISLDPNVYEAYLYKGMILRFQEKIDEAFINLEKYLQHKEDLNVIREMAFCLMDMNKKESNLFLSSWILESMKDKLECMKDGESIFICDILWNSYKLIICTKLRDDFIIQTPISKFKLMSSNTDDEVGIGIIQDGYLKITSEILEEHGKKVKRGREYIPCFYKHFSKKNDFNKFINTILEQNLLNLNKDYTFKDKDGNDVDFTEYICYESDVNMIMNDYNNYRFVDVNIGKYTINAHFPKIGKGFFAFESKLQEGTPFNEGVIILTCDEASKVIHIKIGLDNIHIKKNLLYQYIYIN
ncbi:hypothetical protein QJR60_08420 [Paraclostridium sordellii]|uniref:tetratricopeptide repeat protein n=1 Tax=Paraclostridium sordellii TaxID=1505 RepID=UPI0030D32D02